MMMNKRLILTAILTLLCSLASVAQSVNVKIEGGLMTKRTLAIDGQLFTDRAYQIADLPLRFNEFEFMASRSKTDEPCVIVPLQTGTIYVAASSKGKLKGWEETGFGFTYNDVNNTQMHIYSCNVEAQQKITLPEAGNFAGIIPLAPLIDYQRIVLEVTGKVIDILPVAVANTVFPQNKVLKYDASLPKSLAGKQCAVSLSEYRGVERARYSKPCEITIATTDEQLNVPKWVATGEKFTVGKELTYYVYTYDYKSSNRWIDIPASPLASVLVFADEIGVEGVQPPPGVLIASVAEMKKSMITNPSIVILPNGHYLASCSGAFREPGLSIGTTFFLSENRGQTWQLLSKNNGAMTYQNLFVHRGDVYIMGTRRSQGEVIIRKSTDGGLNWSEATDVNDGILLEGQYHTAPVPMVVHNGRIWRAMETNVDKEGKRVFVMSAPEEANLLKASSWQSTNMLNHNMNWINDNGRKFKQWIEGNVVVAPNGEIVNVLRVDEEKEGSIAAIVHVESPKKISFDPKTDIINMPGAGKKFSIRYDSVSKKYWSITNYESPKDKTTTHKGIYVNGIHCGLIRNNMALIHSDDLINWTVKDILISSDNPFFHGFQYVDWQFDGNDIIAVSRTAFEESRGLPLRQHDANMFTFHRFKNFRIDKIQTINIKSLP